MKYIKLILLLCLSYSTIGQVFHSNHQVTSYGEDSITSYMLTTFEFSKEEMRLMLFYTRSKTVYQDVIYSDTEYGFCVETSDALYKFYRDKRYRNQMKINMVEEIPRGSMVDVRQWIYVDIPRRNEFKDSIKTYRL